MGPRTIYQGSPHARRIKVSETEQRLVEQKGYWKRVQHGGRETAKMSCPECGTVAFLDSPFEVTTDGSVTPQVACACGWHDNVFLQAWGGPVKIGTRGEDQTATPAAAGASAGLGSFGVAKG